MIIRQKYLDKIKPYVGKPVIKAITGLRRVGKSVFVRQLIDDLRANSTPNTNVIYIDMESLEFDFVQNYQILNDYIIEKSKDIQGKIYIFIDEIQDIEEWEKAIASWSGNADRYDITITGSNSNLFSSELATKLTGRFIEFPIYPLSLKEFQNFYPQFTNKEILLENYLRYGGLPGLSMLDELADETVLPFLGSIHDSIMFKDIIKRKGIRNASLLESIYRFTYDNIGNLLSANKISEFLKNQRISANVQSVVNYLEALEEAQLLYKVPRYDIKGKKHLEVKNKFYATDLGLRNSQIGYRANDISFIIENLVFMELSRNFDKVSTCEVGDYEVDFVALKGNKPHYFQVTLSLDNEDTLQRETRSLLAIRDNYPKTIICNAPVFGDGIDGIEVISLIDFLLKEE